MIASWNTSQPASADRYTVYVYNLHPDKLVGVTNVVAKKRKPASKANPQATLIQKLAAQIVASRRLGKG